MLINASGLMYAIKVMRIVQINGRLGGGKTSLAMRLAIELLIIGYAKFLTSNVSNVINVYPDEWVLDDDNKLNAVIVLDEAGKFIKTSASASQYLDALRKINAILIAPTHEEAPPNLGEITIEFQRQLDVIGVPIWSYQWYVKGDKKNAQKFHWINPPEIFGIYSTGEYVISDNGIKESLQNVVSEIHTENPRVYKGQNSKERKAHNTSRDFSINQLLESEYISRTEVSELVERIRRLENELQEPQDKQKLLSLHLRKLR